jgi:hypothetical protein
MSVIDGQTSSGFVGENQERHAGLLSSRPLRDEVSKLLGIGPDCARQWQVPHSRAAASKRLELRAKILGASEAEPQP